MKITFKGIIAEKVKVTGFITCGPLSLSVLEIKPCLNPRLAVGSYLPERGSYKDSPSEIIPALRSPVNILPVGEIRVGSG